MEHDMQRIFDFLDAQRDTVIDIQKHLVAIPALGPLNGGEGERSKADWLLDRLKSMGVTDIREFNAPDDRVPCGHRPNIAAVIPGKNTDKTLWLMGHMDVVPAGDLGLWNSDPFTLEVRGDDMVGRGVEDNHQAIVAGLLTAKALIDLDITPDINLGLLFVADEETGSAYGLAYLADNHPELFGKDDLHVIPDFGNEDSTMVEVAEKSQLWLKVTVSGKQCHASTPAQGINAFRAAADMAVRLGRLHDIYPAKDDLFDPPASTFEPTKCEANVENVNTIPGRQVFYVDCRIIPGIPTEDVFRSIREIGAEIARDHGATLDYEAVQREESTAPTPLDSEVVVKIIESIKKVYKNEPKPMGIGGGTVAAFLRRKGFPAVVWATCVHNAHQPNERTTISGNIGDAKVFADMLFD